jgi:intracellular multiplication protein IcmL
MSKENSNHLSDFATVTGQTEKIIARNGFYVSAFRNMVAVVIAMGLAVVMAVGLAIWSLSRQPEPRYFAVFDGHLTELAPLNIPYVTDDYIRQWVVQAVSAAYALDFKNYRMAINGMQKYFTPDGFENFKSSLGQGRLPLIIQKNYVESIVIIGAPVIVRSGPINDTYVWQVQMPGVISCSSGQEQTRSNVIVNLYVTRTPTWANPFGIAISSIVDQIEK